MAKYRFAALFVNLGLVAAMLLGAPCAAQADIAIQDASTSWATTVIAGADVAFSESRLYTVTAGASVLIVDYGAFVQTPATGNAVTITWNGVALTGTTLQSVGSTNVNDQIFYLWNPTVATNGSLVVTGVNRGAAFGAYTLSGVDTTVAPTAVGNTMNNNGVNAVSVTLPTTTAGQFVAISEACRGNGTAVTAYQTTAASPAYAVTQQFTTSDAGGLMWAGGAYIMGLTAGTGPTITAKNTGDTNGTPRMDVTAAIFSAAPLAQGGGLEAQRGTTLNLDVATAYTGTTFAGPVGGTATINTTQIGVTSNLGMVSDGGVATVLAKDGPGNLLANTVGNQFGSTSTIKVIQGSLTLLSSATASGAGSAGIELAGGKLILQGTSIIAAQPGMAAKWYSGDPAGTWDTNLATATSLDTYTPTATNVQAQLSFASANAAFALYGVAGDSTAQFKGILHVTTAGSYVFDTNSDDGSVMWLNTGAGMTEIVANRGGHATQRAFSSAIALAVGDYPFVTSWYDSGGDGALYLEWNVDGTGVATIPAANLEHLDVTYLTSDMTANNVHVTATGSTIDADSAYYLKLGNLNVDAGMTTNVLPSQPNGIVRFPNTTLAGNATFNVGGTMYAGPFTQAAGGSTVTKTGAGYLLFDKTGNTDNLTTLEAQGGWVGLLGNGDLAANGGANTFMPGATLKINGGGLVVSGTTAGNTVLLNNTINVVGNGSIEARPVGEAASAGSAGAPILVQRDQPLTLGPAGSNLTLMASGFYNMLMAGEVNGAGNLIKTGDSTVTLNNATYTGTTTVQAGTLVIASALLPTETSGITVNAGTLQLTNTANLGSGPITVNAGTMTVTGALTAGNIAVNGGALTANSTVTGGPVAVAAAASFRSQGVATLSGVDSAGTTNFNTDLTVAGGRIRVTAGTTTANGLVTTPEILVAGGDYVQPNSSLTLAKMTLTGGLTTIPNDLQVNSDLSIIGGKLVLGGLLKANGSFTLSDNGILHVTNTNALAGVPAFSVGSGVGHSALLEFGGAQNALTMPVVTVTSGSAITGDTSGLVINGPYNTSGSTRLVLQDGAVYGGTAAPTTDDLGVIRVQKAIVAGDTGSYVIGNDATTNTDIYSGVSFGVWSRSNFRDATTVQPLVATLTDAPGSGLLINMNGESGSVTNAAVLNSAAGATFFGSGMLTLRGTPGGTWPAMSRAGGNGDINNVVLAINDNSLSGGKPLRVTNGEVQLRSTNALAADGVLIIGAGAFLASGDGDQLPNNQRVARGTVHVEAGGMVWTDQADGVKYGATWDFQSGSYFAFRGDNFDPVGNNWPIGKPGVRFVQDTDWCDTFTQALPLTNGNWFITRANGDSRIQDGQGIKAYAGASASGEGVTIAIPNGRNFNANDPINLSLAGGGALNLVFGTPTPTLTIQGDGGNAANRNRLTTAMGGNTWVRSQLIAGDVEVRGGMLSIQMDRGTKQVQTNSMKVIGNAGVPYAMLNLDRSEDGTTQSYGHLEVGGPGSFIYLNDWHGGPNDAPNRVLANGLLNGTLADEIVVNDKGAFYFRLRADTPNDYTLNGVGAAVKINEQIRFTGGYADDASVFGANGTQGWWNDNRRDLSMSILRWNDGNVRPDSENRMYLPNVIIDKTGSAPVVVAIRPDQGIPFLGLTFRTDGTTSNVALGNSGNWSVVDAISAPGTGAHTWTIGEAGQDQMVHTIYGKLGAGMTANMVNGSLTFASSASVESGASFILNSGTTTAFQSNIPLNLSNIEYMGGTLNLFAGQSITAGTAKFGIEQDLGTMRLQLTNGVVTSGGKITSARTTATSSWDVKSGGELTLTGHGALDTVSALSLSGGKLTLGLDGSSVVGVAPGASLTVNASSILNVDRQTDLGGTNRWLTFGPLTLNSGVAAVTAGHGYGVAFGDVSVTGSSAGISTNGPASFGAVNFTGDEFTTQSVTLDASSAQLGALTGGANKHIMFTGGDLHLQPGSTWQGDLYVSNTFNKPARLLVDNDLSGYALTTPRLDGSRTTIQVNGITDILPGSAGTNMSGIMTSSLRLSSGATNVIGPVGDGYRGNGALSGELVLNTPKVDASFVQADGQGNSRPLMLDDGTYKTVVIRSELAGSEFAAPLTLTGMTFLGAPDFSGKDFTLSGAIGGTGSVTSPDNVTYGNFALTKIGPETVTLSGANTFVGGTFIAHGKLVMGNLQAFGDTTVGNVITVDGLDSALTIGVNDADFGGVSGYSILLQNGAALEVGANANGVKLAGAVIGDNTLVLNNSMQGGNAPTAPITGKTIINVPALHSDYALGLSGTIVSNQNTQVGKAVDTTQTNANFQPTAGTTLTINGDPIALGGARSWDVSAGGTVAVNAFVTGHQDLTKTGAGKLVLGGASNDINNLSITGAAGGVVMVGSGAAVPASVTIGAGSLYTVDALNHAYGEVNVPASAGVIALSQNSNASLSFAGSSTLSLGAYQGEQVFSGTLTPGDNGFVFGGGEGTLKITSALSAGQPAQFGWASGVNDPLAMGNTIVAAATNLNGAVEVYQSVQIKDAAAFANVPVAAGVNVRTGGAIDLGDLLTNGNAAAILANIKMLGGGVSNNEVTAGVGRGLLQSDYDVLFGSDPATPYVFGSNFPGLTYVQGGQFDSGTQTYVGGLTHAGLTKVGVSTVELGYNQNYSGTTTVLAGTLRADSTSSFGTSKDFVVAPGATLELKDTDTGSLAGKLTLGGTFSWNQSGSMLLNPTPIGSGNTVVALSSMTPAFNVAQGGKLSIGKIDDSGLGATLTKTGAGELALIDATGASILAKSTTIRVAQGTLSGINTPTNSSLGNATIALAGGTLQLNGSAIVPASGLSAAYFAINNDALHTLAGTYKNVPDRTFTGTGGLLGQTALAQGLANGVMNYGDTGNYTHAVLFPTLGMSSTDDNGAYRSNYMIAWTGTLTVPTTGANAGGAYTFWASADDVVSMWIDLNGDGKFADNATSAGGERIGAISGSIQNGYSDAQRTVQLVAGQSYNVAMTFREGGGGDWSNFTVKLPDGTQSNIMAAGSGQDGMWTHLVSAGQSNFGNDVVVESTSNIAMSNKGTANLGKLTILGGSTLNVDGSVNFTGGQVLGSGARTVAFNAMTSGTNSSITALNTTGGTSTVFQKTGPGALSLTDVAHNVIDRATTMRISQGLVNVMANSQVSSLGQAQLNLDGGTLFVKKGPNETSYGEGLVSGSLTGDWDTTDSNPGNLGLAAGPIGAANNSAPWRALRSDGTSGPDHTTLVYSGQINMQAGTTYSFMSHIDDAELLTINGQQVLRADNYQGAQQGSFTADVSGWYSFELRMGNGTGGYGAIDGLGFGMKQGGQTGNWADYVLPMETMDGTATLLRALTSLPPTLANLGSDVTLTQDSTIDAELNVAFNSLTADSGKTLTIMPSLASGYVRFGSTTLNGNLTVNATGTMYPGQYTQAPGGSTITKTGSGYLVFDNLASASVAGQTNVDIRAGWVVNQVNGANSALTPARFLVNGGGLVLSAATTAGGESSSPVQVTGIGGTMEGRAYGASAVAGAITVRQSGAVSIDAAAVLNTFSVGNYDLKFTGQVSGAGQLQTTAGKVSTDGLLTVDTVWAKGGTLTVNGTANVNTLKVEGGRLNAGSLLTAPSISLTNNGILSVDALGALGGLPAFTVATGTAGPGWLNIGVAQTDIPVITVDTASVVTGNTDNLPIRGWGSPDVGAAKIILKNGAAFYGTTEPTTDDLGSVRLQAAIYGTMAGRTITMGNDPASTHDIYTNAIYGIWSRSNFEDPSTVTNFAGTMTEVDGQGLNINVNNELVPLSGAATFNTANTAQGVRFFGPGKLTVQSAPGGSWTVMTRDGGSASTVNTDILHLAANTVPAGHTLKVMNGQVNPDAANFMAGANSDLEVNNGALLNLASQQPSTGTFNINAGGIVWIYNQTNRMANGTWHFAPGLPAVAAKTSVQGAAETGERSIDPQAMLAFNMNFDPATVPNLPTNVDFLLTQWDGSKSFYGAGLKVSDGAFITGFRNDNSSVRDGVGIRAAAGAVSGGTIGFAEPYEVGNPGNWDTRYMYIGDPVDLRTTDGGALNVVIGSKNEMTTLGGAGTDLTRYSMAMSGRIDVQTVFVAHDVSIESGRLDFWMDNNDATSDGLSQTLRVHDIYGWGGYRPDSGTDYWHGGSNLTMRYIPNFNVGGRSIAGSVYWRGNLLQVTADSDNLTAALETDPAVNPAGAFADKIVLGSNSRIELMPRGSAAAAQPKPWNAAQTVFYIREPIVIEKDNGDWRYGYNVLTHREGPGNPLPGNVNNEVYLSNVILEDGATLSTKYWNADGIGINLTLQGTGTTAFRPGGSLNKNGQAYLDGGNQWSDVMNVVSSSGPSTWIVGETGMQDTSHNMYGQIGSAAGPVTARIIAGRMDWYGGSIAAGSVVDFRGVKFTPGYTDGYMEMWGGVEGGVSMADAGGKILIGSDEDIRVQTDGTLDASGKNRVNKVLGQIEVVSDGVVATRDARLGAGRVWNGACRVVANYKNVVIDNNAAVEFQDWDNANIFADVKSNAGDKGIVWHYTDQNRFYYGDIGSPTQTGAIDFVGNQTARFYGNVYGELIWDIAQAAPSFPDPTITPLNGGLVVAPTDLGYAGFKLAGGTLNMAQNSLTVTNTMINGSDIGTGSLKTSGTGTIVVAGGTAAIPNITGLVVAGGTMRLQSDAAVAWPQVSVVGGGQGTLQLEPLTTTGGPTGVNQTFPALVFENGTTPSLTVKALNQFTTSFPGVQVKPTAGAASLSSQIPSLDIGPVSIEGASSLKLGSSNGGSIKATSVTGPSTSGFGVGPSLNSDVTITGAAGFYGTGRVEGGTLRLAGTDLVYNGSLNNDGTVEVAAGTSANLGSTMITSSENLGIHAGLAFGSLHNNWDTGTANPRNLGLVAGPTGAAAGSAPWSLQHSDGTNGPDATTLVYTGWINLEAATYRFRGHMDDNELLKINGTTVLNFGNGPVENNWTSPAAGWYSFELRLGNGGGGYGAYSGLGFGMKQGDTTTGDWTGYYLPMDPMTGTGTIFRTDIPATGYINVLGGSTLQAGGFTNHAGVTVNSGGSLVLQQSVLPSDTINLNIAGSMDIGAGTVNAATGTVTGALAGNGGTAAFGSLAISSGTGPSINLGTTGHLTATTANINAPFAFNGGNKSTIGTMNIAADRTVTVNADAELAAGTLNVARGAKLAVNGGSNAVGQINVATAGTMELNNAGNQTGLAAVHNLGTVVAKAGVTDMSSTIITSSNAAIVTPLRLDIGSVGNPGIAGTANYDAVTGAYTITGSGSDIWDTQDHFSYLYATAPANESITMTARITSLTAPDAWTKAGLMVRGTTDASAAYGMELVTGGNGAVLQWRGTDGSGSSNAMGNGQRAPAWVKLTRDAAGLVTGYWAPDVSGAPGAWTAQNGAITTMTGDLLFGLAITSHNNGVAGTVVIDNFSGFGTVLPGDIQVNDGATLKLKGFTTANQVSLGTSSKLELKGGASDWSDCLSLSLAAGSDLEIGASGLKVANSTLATVMAEIGNGQITSSLVSSTSVDDRLAAGVLPDGSVAVKATILGDIDMSGMVTLNDLALLESNFGPTNKGWTAGDFNYDGTVDWMDYLTLKGYMGRSFDGTPTVPEPATMGLLVLGLGGLLLKRRRNSK